MIKIWPLLHLIKFFSLTDIYNLFSHLNLRWTFYILLLWHETILKLFIRLCFDEWNTTIDCIQQCKLFRCIWQSSGMTVSNLKLHEMYLKPSEMHLYGPHTHTRCSTRLYIRPVTLLSQINTSSVHRPTRTSPCVLKPVEEFLRPTSCSHQHNPLQHQKQTSPPPPAT
jgi:hypothetical protein